jgi:hypothetical protein
MKKVILKEKIVKVQVGYKVNDGKIYPLNYQSMMLIWGAKTVATDNKHLHKDIVGYFFYIKDLKERIKKLKRKQTDIQFSIESINHILEELK